MITHIFFQKNSVGITYFGLGYASTSKLNIVNVPRFFFII